MRSLSVRPLDLPDAATTIAPGLYDHPHFHNHPRLTPEVKEWCRECLQPGWRTVWWGVGGPSDSISIVPVIFFASMADAVLWRLRWAEE